MGPSPNTRRPFIVTAISSRFLRRSGVFLDINFEDESQSDAVYLTILAVRFDFKVSSVVEYLMRCSCYSDNEPLMLTTASPKKLCLRKRMGASHRET
ncbi:hypothetical protein RCL_jg10701.t1 [Rhizophagus clarus]|uniref:Uncharacterized protein n=1 Tax=Rhizophagus clarus TaxID=94130 RepID=A0A8H3QK12_9GLOM|nr:hypothetical protein RCL_jg10701.t1 [Rhizophagus clarus]